MSKELTKSEAMQAMAEGKKVHHINFAQGEFLFMDNGIVYDEIGLPLGPVDDRFWVNRAWLTGWIVYEDIEAQPMEGRSVGYVGIAALLVIAFFVGFLVSLLF